MTQLSDFYLSTIVAVRASFGFSKFACLPEEISLALGLEPTDARREGENRVVRGKLFRVPFSTWSLSSTSGSKDVNVHLRELLDRVQPVARSIEARWNAPAFSVMWQGTYLYAGSGPFYEADVVRGIASLRADLWQDIYQIDDRDTVDEPKD